MTFPDEFSVAEERRRQEIDERKKAQKHFLRFQKKLTILSFVSLFAAFFLFLFPDRLPKVSEMKPEVLRDPVQIPTSTEPFSFSYHGNLYFVQPQAEYELSALVISQNNINSFFDSYHDSDSVDTRDLCVMWGGNLKSDIYQKISVKNGAWTCYFQAKTAEDWRNFDPFRLSNNHLITNDPEIRDLISSIRIGDQVRIRGFLVDYSDENGFLRQTSLSREDTNESARGGGACEVFFVQSLEILQQGGETSFWLFRLFSVGFIFFFFWKILLFFRKQ